MKKAILVFLGALMLLACTSNVETPPQEDTIPQDNVPQDNVPQDNTPPATQPQADEPEDTGRSLSEILGLSPSYKVTYDFSTENDGETFSGTQTMALKGGKMRIDSEMGETMSSSFMIDDTFYICSFDEEWSCLALPQQQEGSEGSAYEATEDLEENIDDYDVENLPSRTIAGAVAQCFRVTTDDPATTEYCYSNEGVPLYIRTESDGSTSLMEATEYTSNVPDSWFTLPAEPQQLPDMSNIPMP